MPIIEDGVIPLEKTDKYLEQVYTLFEKYKLEVENSDNDFENSFHHLVMNKKTKHEICSINEGWQNLNINNNDTLCQSYSLMVYFGNKIVYCQKTRQIDMCDMYEIILNNKEFIKSLDDVINSDNKKLWIDYTKKKKTFIVMNKKKIIEKLRDVLEKWKTYGYWYFIEEGKCQPQYED